MRLGGILRSFQGSLWNESPPRPEGEPDRLFLSVSRRNLFQFSARPALSAVQRSSRPQVGESWAVSEANDGRNHFQSYRFHLGRDLSGATGRSTNIHDGAEQLALCCVWQKAAESCTSEDGGRAGVQREGRREGKRHVLARPAFPGGARHEAHSLRLHLLGSWGRRGVLCHQVLVLGGSLIRGI